MISYARQQMLADRKPSGTPEHDEQVTLFQLLALNEREFPALKWVHAIPNGGHRHKATAGKLKAEGVKAGVSDIFVPIPVKGYHGLYLEMKAGKNKLTTEQSEFGDFVTSRGYSFYTAWSAGEALTAIGLYLGVELRYG